MRKRNNTLMMCAFYLFNNVIAQTPQTNPELFTIQNGSSGTSNYCDEFNITPTLYQDWLWSEFLGPEPFDNLTYYTTNFASGSFLNNNNFKIEQATDGSCDAAKLIYRYDATPLPEANPINGSGKFLQSKNAFYYGYFEIYAKLPVFITPNGTNVGQQFWLWNQYCADDLSASPIKPHPTWVENDYSELDIFEINNDVTFKDGNNKTTVPASMHWGYAGNCSQSNPPWSYNFNNDIDAIPHPIVDNLSGDSGWHRYGVNWQPDFIDYYIDDILVLHQTYLKLASSLDPTQTFPYTSTIPVSRLQPMRVALETKRWIYPHNPPDGTLPSGPQNFEVDYFRYYKMNPIVTFSISGNNVIATANEGGIIDEDYSWLNVTTNLPISSTQTSTQSTTNSFTIPQGITDIKVTSSTGSNRVYHNPDFRCDNWATWSGCNYDVSDINPLTTSSSTVRILNNTNLSCWNIISTDITSTIDEYYARCITSGIVLPANRNIDYSANTGITLNAGFEVGVGSSFSASNE